MSTLLVLFGDQLFAPKLLPPAAKVTVFMAETADLLNRHPYHQLKLTFHVAAMRHYAEELRAAGYTVHYAAYPDTGDRSFAELLDQEMAARYTSVAYFTVADRCVAELIKTSARTHGLVAERFESPAFLNTREAARTWVVGAKRLQMGDFWKWTRKQTGLLMQADGTPVGGRWSFDTENRLKLPKGMHVPEPPGHRLSAIESSVRALVHEHFPANSGAATHLWLGTTRASARKRLRYFIANGLADFGPYQDAFSADSDLVFHSVLAPYINVGLLTPHDVLSAVLKAYDKGEVAIASVEGFCRQVAGWREFVRAIDLVHGDEQAHINHYNHHRLLGAKWWNANTGVPPLDAAIEKVMRLGYSHHIERLMVLGNFMLLCEVSPHDAVSWFTATHLDAAEWVMGPNVLGMALHADGGLMTTKPYCCGSNYLIKMGAAKKGDWCDVADGLYWQFIERHQKEFAQNHRMRTMVMGLGRLSAERRERIFGAADQFRAAVTLPAQAS